MLSNRPRDTEPEMEVRRALHARGLRYRVDYRLPMDRRRRADIVFTRVKVAVFIDGCFWHGCPEHATMPRTNAEYWEPKLARNKARDAEVTCLLREHGWTVLRFWEHEPSQLVVDEIARVVQGLKRWPESSLSDTGTGLRTREP